MVDRLQVLYVDEDADVAAVTREFLEREDDALDVSTTTSAADALDDVRSGHVDVVVSDYRMPEMTGLEIAAELRDVAPDVPCVLYTARERSEFADDIGDAVAGHVRKGTGTEQYTDLVSVVRDVV